jgi:VTT domain
MPPAKVTGNNYASNLPLRASRLLPPGRSARRSGVTYVLARPQPVPPFTNTPTGRGFRCRIPSLPGTCAATKWGAVYSLIGGDVGAMVAFAAGRFLGKSFVERIVGERFHAMLHRIAKHGFQIILYLRMVPVIPYNALNLLAGASPITFYDYFWATMIGMIPGTILFAFLGDALWHPLSPKFFLALLLIGTSVGCGEIYRRWTRVKIDA